MGKEDTKERIIEDIKETKEEPKYTINDIFEIANVKKHDRLYFLKRFSLVESKTLTEWKKTTGLEF